MEYYDFEVGDLIEFEDGEYSDHSVWTTMKALKPFNLHTEIDKFLGEYTGDSFLMCHQGFGFYEFTSHMVKEGFLEDVGCVTRIHLGSYGKWNKEWLINFRK